MVENYIFLNNEKIDVSNSDPNSSLLDWIRIEKDLKGTKEGCAEGDCGACSILLSPINGGEYRPANSCLLKIGQVSGSDILTIEGIGSKDKPSPIQEALTNHGGSQCGFCTPGFVIAIASLLNKKNKPKDVDIHDALAGNLCRCTGYRPIMDAIYNVKANINLKDTKPWIQSKKFSGKKSNFYYPKTLKEAYSISINKKNTHYLSGGTDLNLNEEVSHNKTNYILLNRILELNSLVEKDNEIQIGAALTLEDTLQCFEKHFSPLAEILRRFGSSQIRSQATIAGNLCTASPIGDTAPSLMALGGTVTIFSNDKKRYISIDDLFSDYRKTVLNPDDILCSIILPIPPSDKSFYAWKVSKRHDQDISTVSIASLIGVNENNIIQSCKICFGGLSATTLRTKEVEKTLLGKNPVTAQNDAINTLKKTIKPLSDLRGSAIYRTDLAVGLLKRLLYCVSNKNSHVEVMKVNINE